MSTIARPPLLRIVVIQSMIVVLVAGSLGLSHGAVSGYSFFIGCLIQIAGSAYFARQVWRYSGARQTRSMVQAMYAGESGKILLTASMFAAVFILVEPLNGVLVFAGYIVMLAVHLPLAADALKRRRRK